MSLNITSYPKKVVNGDVATASKWNAVHHAIGFKMQRRDVEVYSSLYNSSTGKLALHVMGLAEGSVGDYIYFSSGVHSGIAQIDSIILSTTSVIYVNFSSLNTNYQAGGFVNYNTFRKNYFVKTNILGVDSSFAYFVVGTSINKPDASGVVSVDVREFLKSLVDYKDNFAYDRLNWKDEALGGRFNITYSENWTGNVGAFSGISTVSLYGYVNASKQIQQIYGSNMGEYVPFKNYTTGERAKFLSDFEVPTYFPGFPFSLAFIYGEDLFGSPIKKVESILDVNKSVLSTSESQLDILQGGGVNRLMASGNYASNQRYLDIWLESNPSEGITMDYVKEGYVATGYVSRKTTPDPILLTGDEYLTKT